MASPTLGIDISEVNDQFNRLFERTKTRIRRCIGIKKASIHRISSSHDGVRFSGFYHLDKVIDFQLNIYSRHLERFGKIKFPAESQERLQRLEDSDLGFFRHFIFKRQKRKLQYSLALMQEKFSSIDGSLAALYQKIKHQRGILKVGQYVKSGQLSLFKSQEEKRMERKSRIPSMPPDEERLLILSITEEETFSNEIINILDSCQNIFMDLMSGIKALQKNFLEFIKRLGKFADENVARNLQRVFAEIITFISAIFLLKIILIWLGDGIRWHSTDNEFQSLVFQIQYGILRFDNVMDTIAAIPAAYGAALIGKEVIKSGIAGVQQAYLYGSRYINTFGKQALSLKQNIKMTDS